MTAYPATINGIFLRSADTRPDQIAYHYKTAEGWRSVSRREAMAAISEVGMGLAGRGVSKGVPVGILLPTRPEWPEIDAGILGLGGITVGLYPTATAEQSAYLLRHSGAQILFVQRGPLLDLIRPQLPSLPELRGVVTLDGEADGALPEHLFSLTMAALKTEGRARLGSDPEAFRRSSLSISHDDPATYIYTSGTTGDPKGAILSHGNFHDMVHAVQQAMPLEPGREGVAFLPMAHALQRFIAYQGAAYGSIAFYAPSIEQVMETLQEVKPELFGAVPRILEKMYTRVQARVAQGTPAQRRIFAWALRVGERRAALLEAGAPVPWLLERQFALADKVVFKKIKAVLGGRVERVVSGGAPLSPHIARFFHAIGILVLEGYGLTETSAATCMNLPGAFRFGTVGRPLPGARAKVAEDGEILLQGPGIFKGYFRNPEATAEAFTPDGWFKTGDIGEIDRDGFVRITDRKKELIITAGGKNIAPQPIENQLKGIRWVSNAMVHGDRRRYLVALLTLDLEEWREHWKATGATPPADPTVDPEVRRMLEEELARVNKTLASYETIKAFAVLPGDFTTAGGELTPTLKLKRRVLEVRHKALLDSLYPTE